MYGMFAGASSFNQSLDNLDVSSVTVMSEMFAGASSFNQPLGIWNVSSVEQMTGMFRNVTLTTQNYDNLLLGWSSFPLQQKVTFDAGTSRFSINARQSRTYLIAIFGWNIIDDGLDKNFSSGPSASEPTESTYGSFNTDLELITNIITIIAIFGTTVVAGFVILEYRKFNQIQNKKQSKPSFIQFLKSLFARQRSNTNPKIVETEKYLEIIEEIIDETQ